MNSSPSYITKNRLGIYCFQYAIPSIIYKNGKNQPKKLFRKSLRTRERREALKQARILWLVMDKLINKYFDDPFAFGKAMGLLKTLDSFAASDWETVQRDFLDKLDDETDSPILCLALEMRDESLAIDAKNEEELSRCKKIIDLLMRRQLPIVQVPHSETDNPNLSKLIQKWLDIKKGSGLKFSTLTSITQRIEMFSQIVTEINGFEPQVSDISITLIRAYYDLLKQIPARRISKDLMEKTFIELSSLGLNPLSKQSFNEYIHVAVEFLKWVEGDGFPINRELVGILLNSKYKSNSKNFNSIKALPFNDEDLAIIFMSESYVNGNFKRVSDYWVPLIALLTGARLGEICQLHLTDIKQVENVWVIDITNESDDSTNEKSIKTDKGSKRLVPIKHELINLGLIEYTNFLMKTSKILLFPDENRNTQDKFDAISKRFNNKLKLLGIKDNLGKYQRKSFHSFRHTVRTRLSEAGVEEGTIDSIVGHTSNNRSIGEKIYTHGDRINQKSVALKKLKYKFDIKLIKKWNECNFGRILRRNN